MATASKGIPQRLEIDATEKKKFIALVGAPNAGKTTLFNQLTGARFRTVNYPGATVDYSVGNTKSDYGDSLRVVDTPGTYSLFSKSLEEEITCKLLYEKRHIGSTQGVVVVVDATQLARHLLLVRQLQDAGFHVVVALSMVDLIEKESYSIDAKQLSKQLGVPVVPVNGVTGEGTQELISEARKLFMRLDPSLKKPSKWSDDRFLIEAKKLKSLAEASKSKTSSKQEKLTAAKITEKLDQVLLHPVLGILLFLSVMSFLFWSIFWAAAPFMDLVDGWTAGAIDAVVGLAPEALWTDFLGNGIIGSIGAVIIFVPQIYILFLGVSFLEDSGYLARAASLVDKPLSKFGLNGRSFVPLLSGYACAIPGMMAARTIPSAKERFLTLFIVPLMSCSARLPVYGILLAVLFWEEAAWKPGLALAGIYILSLVVGAIFAGVLSKIVKFKDKSFLMMELPYYRRPSLLKILRTSWNRTYGYIRNAGPIIFVFATVFWALTTFPNYKAESDNEKLSSSYAADVGEFLEPAMEPIGGDWRTGVSLFAAFTAREVFVPALALVMNVTEEDEEAAEASLISRMQDAKRDDGSALFTVASVAGLIVFFMIALQCMSTFGVAVREFGGWTMPIVQLMVFNLVAYGLALMVVQGLRALGIN